MRCTREWMRCAEYLERLTASAEVETVLGSIPASSDTVESEGRQMKQVEESTFIKKSEKPPCKELVSTTLVKSHFYSI